MNKEEGRDIQEGMEPQEGSEPQGSEPEAAQPTMNRWLVVVGAIIIQLCLGAIYAWSVFTPSLKAAGWSHTDTQWVFAIGLASFAVTMVWAGFKLNAFSSTLRAFLG